MLNPKMWELVHVAPIAPQMLPFDERCVTQKMLDELENNLATEWRFYDNDLWLRGIKHVFYPKPEYLTYARNRNIIKA